MNFSNLLNPSGEEEAPAPTPNANPAPPLPTSRMSFDFFDSSRNASPATGPGSFSPAAADLVGDSEGEDMDTDAMVAPLTGLPIELMPEMHSLELGIAAHVLAHTGLAASPLDASALPPFPPTQLPPDSPAPAEGVSPASTGDFVPDSDDEPALKRVQSGKGKVKVKVKVKDEKEGTVDVMNVDGEAADAAALLKAQLASRPALPKPKPSPFSAKPKSRTFPFPSTSAASSPALSPGPSGLSNEVHFDPSSSTADHDDSAQLELLPSSSTAPLVPLTTTHLVSSSPSTRPRLSAPFESYMPPRAGAESDEEDEEELKRRAQQRRAATLAARGKSRAKIAEERGGEGEEDDRLYCVCQELYDPERMMIACDRCEEWFHTDCVGIPDDSVELVDQFICPKCQAKFTERTTWRACCARPTCRKPAVPLSKYCSNYCGISVASARLALLQLSNGTELGAFWSRVEGARRKEAEVVDASPSGPTTRVDREASEDARTLARLEAKLEETNARRSALERAVALVEKRLEYLKIAIRRWEALCQATADELASAGIDMGGGGSGSQRVEEAGGAGTKAGGRKKGKGGKKKGPVAATSLPEAQCGLDVRLVYDDAAWAEWVVSDSQGGDEGGGEEEGGRRILEAQERGEVEVVLQMALEMLGGVCLETRKRCERHTGWQKVREADFQVEKAVLTRRLTRLAHLSSSLESQITLHQQAAAFRASNAGRTCDPTRLITVDEFMREQAERGRAGVRMSPGKASGGKSTSLVQRWAGTAVGVNGHGQGGAGNNRAAREKEREDSEGGQDALVDVPADLLKHLSRRELAMLKAQSRA
ncbi:hypothetical protein JCM1841_005505 [Sporobolomyces salmonicolor]